MKTVIKKQFVHIEDGATVHPRPLTAEEPVAAPTPPGPGVRVIELDGVVKAIEVTCSCGEISVIELDSPRPAPPSGDSISTNA